MVCYPYKLVPAGSGDVDDIWQRGAGDHSHPERTHKSHTHNPDTVDNMHSVPEPSNILALPVLLFEYRFTCTLSDNLLGDSRRLASSCGSCFHRYGTACGAYSQRQVRNTIGPSIRVEGMKM
eukprot:3391114-Amphidinium_carterae.1